MPGPHPQLFYDNERERERERGRERERELFCVFQAFFEFALSIWNLCYDFLRWSKEFLFTPTITRSQQIKTEKKQDNDENIAES